MAATDRSRTRLDPDVRRAQILDAAAALFHDEDYATVSLERIAEAAGVTRGLLHHYFGSKRALFVEVIARDVRIPAGVKLVPPGLEGTDLDTVITACVRAWMQLVQQAGGLLAGGTEIVGVGGADLEKILDGARDDLVERMIDEFPWPDGLDDGLLRSALRAYSAFARAAYDEWLVDRTLDETTAEAMLSATLTALITSVVPAMQAAR